MRPAALPVLAAGVVLADRWLRRRRELGDDADADLARRLRGAIADGSVTAAFQPVVDLRDGEIVGIEALARWEDPVLGVVPPSRFVAVAEQSELILDLTERMLDLTLGCRHRLRAAGFELEAAVNVSARFLDDRLVELFSAHGSEGLVLEVTETGLMTDAALAARSLERLVAAGAQVAIDDFGVGRSSLGYLVDFPVSTLKIDRSFIRRMDEGPAHAAVVRATLELGHRLGVCVVAEGVERDEQLDALRDLGCDRVQGYLLAPPLTESDLFGLLRDRRSPTRTTATVGRVRGMERVPGR